MAYSYCNSNRHERVRSIKAKYGFVEDIGFSEVPLLNAYYFFTVFRHLIIVVVVALLFYVHGKHLRSCRDGQLT